MIYSFAILLSVISAMLVVMQVVYVALYVRRQTDGQNHQSATASPPAQSKLPHSAENVTVILCLRGTDPSLPDCLEGLANQQWQGFQLRVVVDSRNDPALSLVEKFRNRFQSLSTLQIPIPIETCSLKCSAILTGIDQLPEATEIIALLDADTVPDPDWLRDLVRPLYESNFAASTGNRWFDPGRRSLGSTLRQIWNAAAIVQIGVYRIAWGGSLAIRRSALDQASLRDRWRRSFCEDTLLSDQLWSSGMDLVRVPGLIAVNRESIGLTACLRWIMRQLLTIRLHNRKWPLIQLHAFATFCASLTLPVSVACFVTGQSDSGTLLLITWVLSQLGNGLLFLQVRTAITTVLKQRKLPPSPPPHRPESAVSAAIRSGWTFLAAFLLTQWIYPWICLRASCCRKVEWRGIEYAIESNHTVRLIAYRPYQSPAGNDVSGESI